MFQLFLRQSFAQIFRITIINKKRSNVAVLIHQPI